MAEVYIILCTGWFTKHAQPYFSFNIIHVFVLRFFEFVGFFVFMKDDDFDSSMFSEKSIHPINGDFRMKRIRCLTLRRTLLEFGKNLKNLKI